MSSPKTSEPYYERRQLSGCIWAESQPKLSLLYFSIISGKDSEKF